MLENSSREQVFATAREHEQFFYKKTIAHEQNLRNIRM